MIELRPFTPEFIEAILGGDRERASELLDAELPDEFPREGEKRFLALRLRQMGEDDRFLEWCPFAVVLDGRLIGNAGYHGPPGVNAVNDPEAIEIGYAIEPSYRRRGHATAAASALLRRAEERGVRHYVASCSPENDASLAVIRKLGFRHTGEAMDDEDGLELVFELRLEP